jgi:hypothetical protein
MSGPVRAGDGKIAAGWSMMSQGRLRSGELAPVCTRVPRSPGVAALQAPSGGNLQPWRVLIAFGDEARCNAAHARREH